MWGCGLNCASQVDHDSAPNIVPWMLPIKTLKGKIVTKIVAGGHHTGAFIFNTGESLYFC